MIELTEAQATALGEILESYNRSLREAEVQSGQTILEVEQKATGVEHEPWLIELWGILMDRVPHHEKSIERDRGTITANWLLTVTPSDISNWTDVRQSATKIRTGLTENEHPRVAFRKVGNKDSVIVYEQPRWI